MNRATLVAKKVDIGLSSRQLTDPLHMDTITLVDGTLNLSPQTAPLPFQADRLQLNNMAFDSPNTEWDLSAQKVTGGVSPWQPEAGNVLGKKAQIQMSAGSLTLNGVPASNVLIQGDLNGKEVVLKNARRIWYWEGAFTLSAVATEGVSKSSKLSVEVPEILLTEAIEIIPCSEAASANLRTLKAHE